MEPIINLSEDVVEAARSYGKATQDWPSYGDRGFLIPGKIFDYLGNRVHPINKGISDGIAYFQIEGYVIIRDDLTPERIKLDEIWRDSDKSTVLKVG